MSYLTPRLTHRLTRRLLGLAGAYRKTTTIALLVLTAVNAELMHIRLTGSISTPAFYVYAGACYVLPPTMCRGPL